MSLFGKLKRRNVFRIEIARYVLFLQAAGFPPGCDD
jgi:hypothetical protein